MSKFSCDSDSRHYSCRRCTESWHFDVAFSLVSFLCCLVFQYECSPYHCVTLTEWSAFFLLHSAVNDGSHSVACIFPRFFGTPQNRHHFGFTVKTKMLTNSDITIKNKHVRHEPWRIRSFFCCSFVFAKPFLLFFSCTANSVFSVCVCVVRLSLCE
jgi:hypothetical protein